MSQSSVFPTAEPRTQRVNCRKDPDAFVYYDGSTTATPTLSATGTIVFGGATYTNRPPLGIGFTGYGPDMAVPYEDILNGGAGVKIRGKQTATQNVVRFYTRAGNTDPRYTNIVLQARVIETCANPLEYPYEQPVFCNYVAGVYDTELQKLTKIANDWNRQSSQIATATVLSGGSEDGVARPSLVLTTANPGERLSFLNISGLDGPFQVVDGYPGAYDTDLLTYWTTGVNSYLANAPAPTLLKAIELRYVIRFHQGNSGSQTSNINQAPQGYMETEQSLVFIYQDNANGNAAAANLITILQGPAAGNVAQPYLAKLGANTTAADTLYYGYRVIRTDNGDAAAYAQMKTDYSPIVLFTVSRDSVGGTTTYGFYTNSDTTAKSGTDTFTKGFLAPQMF